MLRLRDLQSSETFVVPPQGATLGRAGGEADIAVNDKSVSKKHAKLYERGGKWFLEDLQSANGTYLAENRISKPVVIKAGIAFSLSSYQFEVIDIGAGDDADGVNIDLDQAQPRTRVGEKPIFDDADGGDPYPEATSPPKGKKNGAAPPPERKSRGSQPERSNPGRASRGGNDDLDPAAKKGFGEVMLAIPRAVAHYTVAVPLLALNPLGTVRKSIEDQKFGAMGTMELIAWGLPAQLISAAVGIVALLLSAIVVAIRLKSFGISTITGVLGGSIKAIVIAVGVAIVAGFIFHPVLGWVIRFLKGESDEVSRSNYFVALMTASILLGFPAAASAVLGLIPIPFIGLLPLVLSLVGTLLMAFVAFSWMKFFNVHKIVPILILVGGLLGCVSTALAAVRVITGGIKGGGTASTTLTPEQQAALDKANELAAANGNANPDSTPKVEPTKRGGKDPIATPALAMNNTENPGDATPKGDGGTGYAKYAMQRDAVEKAIADDPTLLNRDAGLLKGYRDLHKAMYEVKKKYPAKDPSQVTPNQRLIEAETYQRTAELVDWLYRRVNKSR